MIQMKMVSVVRGFVIARDNFRVVPFPVARHPLKLIIGSKSHIQVGIRELSYGYGILARMNIGARDKNFNADQICL